MELSMRDFISFKDLIYERCGINFPSKKIYFVKKRVSARMEALGYEKVNDYLHLLKFQDPKHEEFQDFMNLLTTNETYMFREFDQLAAFAEGCLAEVCERKKKNGDNHISILCAGCSTGEEAYTLAIILMEMLEPYSAWNVKIVATDIDTSVLATAKKAEYSSRAVKDVPDEYLEEYFRVSGRNYLVKNHVKRPIQFKHLNLMDKRGLEKIGQFDFVFCRNVLIYFDEESRKKVVGHFYEQLHSGGFIFLGHSESIGRISTSFLLRKVEGMIVYQKKL